MYVNSLINAKSTYLVIRRRSKKLGDPCLLGIDGDRDFELLLELCELRELELELRDDPERDELDEDDLLPLRCPELKIDIIK